MRLSWTERIISTVIGVSLSTAALGQMGAPAAVNPADTANPMSKEVQTNYARLKDNILKAADKMPAEDFSFKPTPEIRSFARVLNHITEAQKRICGAINQSKLPDPLAPPETADKAAILAALKASFTECDHAYAGLTDANMTVVIDAGPFKRSRLGLLWGNVAHDNEQYSALATYMRLKGQVPPSSER